MDSLRLRKASLREEKRQLTQFPNSNVKVNVMVNIFRAVGHVLAAITKNCSQFGEAWEAAACSNQAGKRWEGEWRSEMNGHHGALRCVLNKMGEKIFLAHFHARYSKFLRVCYSVPLRAERAGEVLRLAGKADLGALAGGVYYYEGEVFKERFVCNYRCQTDRGRFEMHSPRVSGPE